ncbi:MAG: YbaB/EbfC family nucleoid-associated protein [Candidatus Omnitrophica bacterium]|nr:YbaB/EbfC family nucleoid-associated protein [Candidatus Omnitrophota bacterium]
MFDKMKQLMDMQRKMQDVKRQLESAAFDVLSSDGLIKITMNGAQEVKDVTIQADLKVTDKAILEKAARDAYNKAIKRSHDLAAEKMRGVTGLNLPGLT